MELLNLDWSIVGIYNFNFHYKQFQKVSTMHFLCSTDKMDALDMAQPIVQELVKEWIEMFDAHHHEYVRVIAPLLCIICDNPRASQLFNHLGASVNKYCHFCMVMLICKYCPFAHTLNVVFHFCQPR